MVRRRWTVNGKTAYEAYRKHSDGKSLVTGKPIPEWDELHGAIKDAWNAAARAVLRELLGKIMPGSME
jgi:hypothetical protein